MKPHAMACWVALVAWRAAGAFDAAAYLLQRDVLPAAAPAQFAQAAFDAEVYAAAHADFRDVRLVSAAGAEQPYRIVRGMTMRERVVRAPQAHRIVSINETASNALEVVVELTGWRPAADGLAIVTPLKDFERAVAVYRSDDGTAWTPVLEQALVFDYTRFMDVHNHEIRLPTPARAKYLKLVIHGVTDEQASSLQRVTRSAHEDTAWTQERAEIARRPLRIDRIEVWRDTLVTTQADDEISAYPLAAWSVSNDSARQTTMVELHTRRVPLTQIVFDIHERNFSRRVDVCVPAGDSGWRCVHQAVITRLNIGEYTQEQAHISVPEQRHERYRIVIHNGDSPALAINSVRVRGPVYRLQWMPDAGAGYTLYYGNAQARMPRYDVAALAAGTQRNAPHAPWQLGPARPNPAYTGALPRAPVAGRGRVLLPVAMAVMVAALALAIWHASRRVGTMPK